MRNVVHVVTALVDEAFDLLSRSHGSIATSEVDASSASIFILIFSRWCDKR